MDYDLVIIGAGWAGLNAAKTAKDAGLKVALVERGELGGTCLNRGCIPTKALIQSAKILTLSQKSKNFGIITTPPKIDFPLIQARKDSIVEQLRYGLEFRLKGIDIIKGEVKFISPGAISISRKTLKAKHILIASGAKPMSPGFLEFDAKKIISSDDILNLKTLPKSLIIIGGGVIGCEFASLFAALGVRVSIVEKMPQLLPGVDVEVAKRLESLFKKRGITVSTSTDASGINLDDYQLCLVAIGRQPITEGLGLEAIGLGLEGKKIGVDEYLRTHSPSIYAAGDCTARLMLAHFAAYQGNIAAANIAHPDKQIKADNNVVPNCIFTYPEVSNVGLNQEQAIEKGFEIGVRKFDFLSSGMAKIQDETAGFIKVIIDLNSGLILGASIIGPLATELIGTFALAISNRLSDKQLKNTIFAHPTLSEAVQEAL